MMFIQQVKCIECVFYLTYFHLMKDLLGCDPHYNLREFAPESKGFNYLFCLYGFVIHNSSNFDFIWETIKMQTYKQKRIYQSFTLLLKKPYPECQGTEAICRVFSAPPWGDQKKPGVSDWLQMRQAWQGVADYGSPGCARLQSLCQVTSC